MIASTVERVPQNTTECVNRMIRRQTERHISQCAAGGREAITRRLAELDQEWDVERTLEANAATATLVGLTLGTFLDRRWYLFPAAVAGFLLQHAVQGWCPPVPILRRLGFRTQPEIDYERYALKSLRGDFRNLPTSPSQDGSGAKQLVEAMRR